MKNTLIYVHDPMCSWCWGFENTRQKLFAAVSDQVIIKRLLGGLAPDSDDPMPVSTRQMVQSAWYRVAEVTGAEFNHDFWQECAPRRSTYPASRAVIAARAQGPHFEQLMTAKVQQAYYLQARNPSDDATLIELAEELGLNKSRFAEALNSDFTRQKLQDEIQTARSIGVDSFPSLVLEQRGRLHPIRIDYNNLDRMLEQLEIG